MSSSVIDVGTDDYPVHALQNSYPVDGRVSWHPGDVRGFAPVNCYALTTDTSILLVDTGCTAHETSLLGQVAMLGAVEKSLSLFPLRLGEFDSVGNAYALATKFGVDTLYGSFPDAWTWCDLTCEHSVARGTVPTTAIEAPSPSVVVHSVDEVPIGDGDTQRILDIVVPGVRLIPTHWAFDRHSGTLFTSDMFGYGISATDEGPWTFDEADDQIDTAAVDHHLSSTRYWWLEGAKTARLRASIAELFDRLDVTCIAPGFGAIIRGKAVVERHVGMLLDVLAARAGEEN